MKKQTYLALTTLGLLLSPSCSQDERPKQDNPQTEQNLSKQSIMLSLSGTFGAQEGEEPRAYLKPTDDAEIKISFDKDELMKDETDATGKTKRVKNTKTAKLTLYFVNAANPSNVQTAIVDPTDFRQNSDGSYTIEYHGSVELTGVDMSTGNWYISGGYRLQKTENVNSKPTAYMSLNQDGLIQYTNGAAVTDFPLPFVFGWTKLTTKATQPSLANNHAQQLELKFVPDGYYLRIRAINNLVEDIKLGAVHLQSSGLSTSGISSFAYTYPATDNLSAGKTPYITGASTGGRVSTVSVYSSYAQQGTNWGDGRVLSAGQYFTTFLPFNNPETPTTGDNRFMRFQFGTIPFPQGQTASGGMLDARDRVAMPATSAPTLFENKWPAYPLSPVDYITDWWRGLSQMEYTGFSGLAQNTTKSIRNQFLPENKSFKLGRVHNVNFKINSDLMITELYTTKYSARNGSYGLIELYNPTLDPIDLSKYALVRFSYETSDNGNTYKVRNLPATELIEADANLGGKLITALDKALLLPLDLKSGEPSGLWAVNSFNRIVQAVQTNASTYPYALSIRYPSYTGSGTRYTGFSTKVVDFSTKGYISGLKPIQPGATIVNPGKTIIVLFGGYALDNYSPNEEDRKIFAKIAQAVAAGYCEHVVAIAHGATGVQPSAATAGVTTADIGDGFSLVRAANVLSGTENGGYPGTPGSYTRVATRFFVDATWNSNTFDGNNVVKGLISSGGTTALIRRPYGPYLWNSGFQHPDNPSRYYQAVYSIEKATFGAPYHASYDSDKTWEKVVKPKVEQRNSNLLR